MTPRPRSGGARPPISNAEAQNNLHIIANKDQALLDTYNDIKRAEANAARGITNAEADQEVVNHTLAAQNTDGNNKFEIQAAGSDEIFVINSEKFKAKTYCLGWEVGQHVIFLKGSPLGACTSAKLYNVDKDQNCDVYCE